MALKISEPIINNLIQGKTVKNVDPDLYVLFRPTVQPYLISWFKYKPRRELAKLQKPIFIIQGSTDIQVSINDAEILAESNQNAKKIIIKDMNHILKEADMDRPKNIQTYNEPERPIKSELTQSIVEFINKG